MDEYIGKRILITLRDNDAPQMTSVVTISPNGKYALLSDSSVYAAVFGWTAICDIKVLDVIGGMNENVTAKTTMVSGGLHG